MPKKLFGRFKIIFLRYFKNVSYQIPTQKIFDLLSHEFRTPIHQIKGFCELLISKKGLQRDREAKELLEMLDKSVSQLIKRIEDIIILSSSSQKNSILDPIGSLTIYQFATELIQKNINKKSIIFQIDADSLKNNAVFFSNKDIIFDTLTRLFTNAIQFTEEGQIRFKISHHKNKLIFEISDTGIGIAAHDMNRIFEPLEQIYSGLDRPIQGLGVGLAICKKNIESLDGQIQIESQLGKGSNVRFSFPIEKNIQYKEPFDITEPTPSTQTESIDFSQYHILACDDDPFNREYLRMILDGLIQLDLVDSGEQAIEKTKKERYDLILMDIQMPKKDGIETLKEIRANSIINEKTPILAITAQANRFDKQRFINHGFNGYLAKPFDEEGLLTLIKYWLLPR